MTGRPIDSTLDPQTTGTGPTDAEQRSWEPTEGDVINDRWRLDRRASSGSTVDTWEGKDLQLERRIALQVVRTSQLDEPGALRSFERRVRLLAQVEHPNLVRVFDVVETRGHLVSISEWVDGVVLEDVLSHGFQGWWLSACVGVQLAAGLGALHASGVLHRNLFPPNVMVTPQGTARITGGGRMRSLLSNSTLTDQDLLLIKTGYVAPERIEGLPRDPRVDVYALGVVLWEVATGQRAIELTHEEPDRPILPRVTRWVPDVPEPFDDLVFAATRPDADARPTDGGEFHELLRELVPARPEEVVAKGVASILDEAGVDPD